MSDPVPFIDLAPQHASIRSELEEAMLRVLGSQQFILGAEVERFERAFAERLGLPEGGAVGVSSGTDALLVAMMALGVGSGDRVLTVPFSFFATAGCVRRLGATPEFVDIDPVTYNLDPAKLETLDPSRYKAVIVVHLFGRCADMDAISSWAGATPVIEDAAQAVGAKAPSGASCGGLGRLGCFSFFPTKNLGAAGDGGAVTGLEPELVASVRRLRVHGATRPYEHQVIGGNFRLDALQAAVLDVKLRHLDGWTEARRSNARAYDAGFRAAGLGDRLGLPPLEPAEGYVAHQYVIRCPERDELRAHLAERGVASAIYYPAAFHLQPAFEELGHGPGAFPESERAAQEVLALPVFAELGEQRRQRVIDAVSAFFEAR